MTGRLVVVSGTGTGIGKTHFAEALVRALARTQPRVAGVKPVESGVVAGVETDAARLERASSFHVKRFGHAFPDAVSPHLAARLAGEPIDLDAIVAGVAAARAEVDTLVVELPGGLFSPLSDALVNADLARVLGPDATLVVIPDRLGALHDAIAARRAAAAVPLRLDGMVLIAPAEADPSTGSNAAELARVVDVPVVATLPRAPVEALAASEPVASLAARLAVTPSGPAVRP